MSRAVGTPLLYFGKFGFQMGSFCEYILFGQCHAMALREL